MINLNTQFGVKKKIVVNNFPNLMRLTRRVIWLFFLIATTNKKIMTNLLLLFLLSIIPMNGMYMLFNDLEKGVFHYFDFHFIKVDWEARESQFLSREGKVLLKSSLSLEANRLVCKEAALVLTEDAPSRIKLQFMDTTMSSELYYLKLTKIKMEESVLEKYLQYPEIEEINGYLFFEHSGMLKVKNLYPILSIDQNRFEYFDLTSNEKRWYFLEKE